MKKTILTTMLPYLICNAAFAQEKGTVQNKNNDIPGVEKLVINAPCENVVKRK